MKLNSASKFAMMGNCRRRKKNESGIKMEGELGGGGSLKIQFA